MYVTYNDFCTDCNMIMMMNRVKFDLKFEINFETYIFIRKDAHVFIFNQPFGF